MPYALNLVIQLILQSGMLAREHEADSLRPSGLRPLADLAQRSRCR